MNTTTIRPGILVAVRTTVTGGVAYKRDDIAPDEAPAVAANDTSATVEAWRTIKVTTDAQEHARAISIRALAKYEITKLCMDTSFGWLAPEAVEPELNAAQARARAMVDEFNATAKYTRIGFGLLKGRVAASDEEAVRAITAEIGGLVATMNTAIDKLDVDAIRAAAGKAASLAAILGDEEQKTVTAAVEAARKAARMIVKRIAKGGEPAAKVMADMQRGALERARIAFLDLDERTDAPAGEELPAADLARVAGLDLEVTTPDLPEVAPEVATPPAPTALDLDDGPVIAVPVATTRPAIDWD